MKRLITALALVLCNALQLDAQTTRYLATTGSDATTCANSANIGTPKLTFASALACMTTAGDTLLVRGGTYTVSVDASLAGSGTNWTCGSGAKCISTYPAETVWIQPASGANSAVSIGGVSFQIWTGINLDGANTTGAAPGLLQIGFADHIRWQDSEIKNSCWSAIVTTQSSGQGTYLEFLRNNVHDGDICVGGDPAHAIYLAAHTSQPTGVDLHILIEGNTFTGFTGTSSTGIHIYGSGGTEDNRLNGITVRGNLIYGNTLGAALAGNNAVAGTIFENNIVRDVTEDGVTVYSASTAAGAPKLYNNTIDGNGGYGIAVGPFVYVENCLITNNMITNNVQAPIKIWNASGSTYCTITYNLRNGNGNGNAIDDMNSLSTVSNEITSVPSYVNAAGNDFNLQTGSAAKDAGTTITAVTVDFANVSRPQGPAYDIGAYEFPVAAPSTIKRLRFRTLNDNLFHIPPVATRTLSLETH